MRQLGFANEAAVGKRIRCAERRLRYPEPALQSMHGPSQPQEQCGAGISPASWASQGGGGGDLFCVLVGPAAR